MAEQAVESVNIQSSAADTTVDSILTAAVTDESAAAGGGTADVAVQDGAGKGNEGTPAEGESAADGAKATAEDTKAAEIPDAYEFTLPEGVTLDSELLDKVTPIFKAKGFSKDEAQGMVDLYTGKIAELAQAQQEAWKGQLEAWKNDIQSDPEFGGTQFKATVKSAQTIIARYGDDQLKQELAAFGVGNMPSLIRMLARAGKDMAEDKFVGAGGASGVDDTPPELRMYPTMRPK